MNRFSDEAIELDPAYESLYDTSFTSFDEFMGIACEGDACYDYDDDDDEYIDFEDDDDDEFDDDDDDDDELEEDEESCCKENAITDATPQQKRERYFKMLDANPRFSEEQRKTMKENYDKTHPEGLKAIESIDFDLMSEADVDTLLNYFTSATESTYDDVYSMDADTMSEADVDNLLNAMTDATESAADYERALRMFNRNEDVLTDDVEEAYDSSEYDDDYIKDHAAYSSSLRTGFKSLVEKNVSILNKFQGDLQARYSANNKTSYARESVDEDYSDFDTDFDPSLNLDDDLSYLDSFDTSNESFTYDDEDISVPELSAYDEMALENFGDMDGVDIDEGLENCQSALADMIRELDNV